MVFNTGAAGDVEASQYQIARSLRWDHLSNAYLLRTPVATGERRAFTFSGWIKRTNLGNSTAASLYLFTVIQDGSNYFLIYFHNSALDTFSVLWQNAGAARMQRRTSAVARDPAGWFHLCVAFDTRPAAPTCIIECNGVTLPPTVVNNNTWAQNDLLLPNTSGIPYYFGTFGNPPSLYSSFYLAEVHMIDGQALAASSFGRTDATTGTWIPKPYIGTYGTNGAYLKFADNSNTTAATLGKDSSGNNNNFTPTNFSVAAGIGNDSLVDTPTNYGTDAGVGGELRGNYCVLNSTDMTTLLTTYEGNLAAQGGNASIWATIRGTVWVNSGKWYWEAVPSNVASSVMVGVLNTVAIAGATATLYAGMYSGGYAYHANGQKWNNNVGAAYGATYTTNDTIGIALDMTAGTITFYKNGVSQGVAYSGITGYVAPAFSMYNSSYWLPNFGQRPFAYAAPSGFQVLCSANMPSTTPDLPASFTGNGLVDGPFVWANGVTNAVTINGNVATRGTHFDGVAGGIKLRTNSGSYNTAGTNTVTAETPGISFKYSRAQPNG